MKGAGSTAATERPVASAAELTAATEAVPEQYRAGYAIAAWCQLRRGEILGLQRRHIDLKRQRIKVEQEWVLAAGRPFLKESPTTAAGYWSIDIPTRIVPLIEAHRERHVGPEPEAWLCGNGRPISPRHFYRAWEEARKKVALKMTFHDLGHSGLTWSARREAPLAELMLRGATRIPRPPSAISLDEAHRPGRQHPWQVRRPCPVAHPGYVRQGRAAPAGRSRQHGPHLVLGARPARHRLASPAAPIMRR